MRVSTFLTKERENEGDLRVLLLSQDRIISQVIQGTKRRRISISFSVLYSTLSPHQFACISASVFHTGEP